MGEYFEIRWHGRGGQGAKTAALLFGTACMATGKFFQGFPEYGPERTGAPVRAYNRLSDKPITIHSGIKTPDVVVVLDPTLIKSENVVEGLKDDGVIIVNTPMSPQELRKKLGLKPTQKLYTIDASGIARDTLKRDIPNTPMLGALVRVTGIISLEELLKDTEAKLRAKFRDRPQLVDVNLEAIKRAYNEVREA